MKPRQRAAGPTWRLPPPAPGPDEDAVFVACRCGTDMSFAWPRAREAVRCFACGNRFARPGHLPASPALPPWRPPAPPPVVTRAGALLLLLTAIAAGLLGAALTIFLLR